MSDPPQPAAPTSGGRTAADSLLERIAVHVPGLLYQFALRPDLSARFLYVSPRAPDVLGVDPALATRDAMDVFAAIYRPDRQSVVDSIRESARDLSVWRSEFRARRAGGELRWIQGSASPQRESDGTVVWYGYLQDVTERHELERARRDAAVAEAANRAKTEFLSHMSHELRTPLNAVLGFAQLMEIDEQEPPTPNQRRRLKLIRDAGDHLLQMIADLLDLTRIESRALALTIEALPLSRLVDEVVALLHALASQSRVALAVDIAADAPTQVRADRTRLRQVLLNLISNAIKYNRPGGSVDLRIERAADGKAVLHVRDSGHGIAEHDMARLFEPFHRGRHAFGAIEGTGIGLSLSRSLVTLMGGRIDVQSTLGVGSVFSVALPAA